MVYSGEVADAETVQLLQWAALRGPFPHPPERRPLTLREDFTD